MRAWQKWGILISAAACFSALAWLRPEHPLALGPYRQVTGWTGIARAPSLSPDGKLVAFTATPDDHTAGDIWVQAVDGPVAPLRLTDNPGNDYDPEFSPDAKTVYFTSDREPAGIYRVPVSGGANELVIEDGYTPKVSPDGKTLLYGAHGKVFMQPIDGGEPAALLPEIENSYSPVWSPDGTRILVTAKANGGRDVEWWLAQRNGGAPRKTEILATRRNQGFTQAFLNVWLPGDQIVFTGLQGENGTLWKVSITPDGQVSDKPARVTDDPQGDDGASFASGRLAFARTQVAMNFFALPLNASGDQLTGPPQPLTSTPGQKGRQSLSGDGVHLLYSAEEGDRFSLLFKNLTNGKEKRIERGAFFSTLTPDGSRYIYDDGTKLLRKAVGWWPFWASAICEKCGTPVNFSDDGKRLLLWSAAQPQPHIDVVDLDSHAVNRVVWTAGSPLSGPHFSPDGQWISFVAGRGDHRWQSFVAPVRTDRPLLEMDWIPVSVESDSFHFAFWSAKGDMIYILTARGGSGNLNWLEAQRLDPETKRPIGDRFELYQFSEPRVPIMDPIWNTVTVVRDKIVLELGDASTNIWIKEAQRASK